MIRAIALCLALAPAAATIAHAQTDVVRGEFRSGWQTASGTHMAALHLQLAPNWKTYWRAPGDAGIPPHFDWTGSENVGSVRFHWPAPDVFRTNGMKTVGYHDQLVLPIEVTPRDPRKPVRLMASIDLGVCKDICVPATLLLGTALPAPGRNDNTINAALKARPSTGTEAGLTRISCTLEPIRDGMRITARMELPAQGRDEVVIFESGISDVWVSESQVRRDGRKLTAVADMVPPSGRPFALNRSEVVLTVIGGNGRAVEVKGCPAD
ncbi:MAG: protein-disulfide reductase DsbD family protein [Pseudotabrizicola sp.]|uniref:protein-disulfide reductase DsbD domain-containing protein n=1 Tax=Pseudotabrizicola sp. TaxID=2939647 RepID=UPI00273183EB|nr:protein-disulfide reductase DsbD domain-containing protein [Pseudotabrizicola sp.]MDP2079931.1 protein-disulfide reductase DsbD family protein [Pseudotabrizicola sp.]MDZ7575670.1 protein-disulfide reductase DsbD family protein [Pseudotabrizicola sp.]